MSHLSLFSSDLPSESEVISFTSYVAQKKQDRMWTTLVRARLEHQHRECPLCCRVTVEPIELNDALLNRQGAEIPSSATLVGFSCNACGHEWPVHNQARQLAEVC